MNPLFLAVTNWILNSIHDSLLGNLKLASYSIDGETTNKKKTSKRMMYSSCTKQVQSPSSLLLCCQPPYSSSCRSRRSCFSNSQFDAEIIRQSVPWWNGDKLDANVGCVCLCAAEVEQKGFVDILKISTNENKASTENWCELHFISYNFQAKQNLQSFMNSVFAHLFFSKVKPLLSSCCYVWIK